MYMAGVKNLHQIDADWNPSSEFWRRLVFDSEGKIQRTIVSSEVEPAHQLVDPIRNDGKIISVTELVQRYSSSEPVPEGLSYEEKEAWKAKNANVAVSNHRQNYIIVRNPETGVWTEVMQLPWRGIRPTGLGGLELDPGRITGGYKAGFVYLRTPGTSIPGLSAAKAVNRALVFHETKRSSTDHDLVSARPKGRDVWMEDLKVDMTIDRGKVFKNATEFQGAVSKLKKRLAQREANVNKKRARR